MIHGAPTLPVEIDGVVRRYVGRQRWATDRMDGYGAVEIEASLFWKRFSMRGYTTAQCDKQHNREHFRSHLRKLAFRQLSASGPSQGLLRVVLSRWVEAYKRTFRLGAG